MPDKKGNKVQVTLSKFFSSSAAAATSSSSTDHHTRAETSQSKTKSKKNANTDEGNEFQIIPDKASKKRSLKAERDSAPAVKKSCLENINNNGVRASPSTSSVPAAIKLKQYDLTDNGTSDTVEVFPLESKGCTEIDFTPSGSLVDLDQTQTNEDEETLDFSSSKKTPVEKPVPPLLQQFKSGKSKGLDKKYTPLEQQFVDIKAQYPDAVLFVECGYKYRFFGEDAEIAAQVLKIYCHLDHNFMTASIPVHRLFVHIRRLVSAGYKVGVVKQTETAHLKAAGENKSAPFSRKLSALYTKSTLIGEDVGSVSDGEGSTLEDSHSSRLQLNSYLMCVFEQPLDSPSKTREVGLVCLDPGTGDVIFDSFHDGLTYTELETRILHLQPVEILLSSDVSRCMKKIVCDLTSLSSTEDDKIRLETVDKDVFAHASAFATVSEFYGKDQTSMQSVACMPKPVISCLAALITYLKDFHLENILTVTSNFRQFSTKSKFMNLSGSCLRNLEVFQNSSDGSEKGSLFWMLNHTCTKFGARLLRFWIAQPILDIGEIQKRQDAVEELRKGDHQGLKNLKEVLSKMPDVDKGLGSIFHRKCSPLEFYNVTKALERVRKEIIGLQKNLNDSLSSTLLIDLLLELPDLLSDIGKYSAAINEKAARTNDKTELFVDESLFPAVKSRKEEIREVIAAINNHRKEVRLILKQPALNFVTVMQTEFLIEVKNTQLKSVPSEWTQLNSTKVVSRFHTPFIVKEYRKLNGLREQLVMDVTEAWHNFIDQFSNEYTRYKKAVGHLATLDCLMSLAKTASQDSFCKPRVDADTVQIEINQGRHPIIDALKGEQEQFVPNDTHLNVSGLRVMVISGPNMGGKSSYIRQVALITIMAQIGSFVPAESAHLGVVDGIYTRMGAADEIFKGRSTFMVELQEAGEIMEQASERSLVILDELGRGTSTHDGVAIAHACLRHFIEKSSCLVLFVTHFPLMSEFHDLYPNLVQNFHMAFLLNDNDDEEKAVEAITFLYHLSEGAAEKSYGLNVARLAEVSSHIIRTAAKKSKELEDKINYKLNSRESFITIWRAKQDELKSSMNFNEALG